MTIDWSTSQAECRGFDSLRPLQWFQILTKLICGLMMPRYAMGTQNKQLWRGKHATVQEEGVKQASTGALKIRDDFVD